MTARGVLLLVALATPLQAQDSTLRLPGNAMVDVTLRTGHLVVRGTAGATGAIRGGGGNYQVRPSGVGLVVSERGRARDVDDRLELDLPYGVRLIVHTTSADVTLRDLRGDVEVSTLSGDVVVDHLAGPLRVDTFSGDVTVTGAITRLQTTTVSGDVSVHGVRGDAELRTTSGAVRLGGDRLTGVTAESISGDITLEGTFADDARLRAATYAGDITVHLPAGVRGSLDITTLTGELDTDGPLTLLPGDGGGTRGRRGTRRYELGGSGPLRLDFSTSSGNVRLVRGRHP